MAWGMRLFVANCFVDASAFLSDCFPMAEVEKDEGVPQSGRNYICKSDCTRHTKTDRKTDEHRRRRTDRQTHSE